MLQTCSTTAFIVLRQLDETICGICGVVREVYLDDGNEKNWFSRKEVKIKYLIFFILSVPLT